MPCEQTRILKGNDDDGECQKHKFLQIGKILFLGSAMIMNSAGLIAFNKHLISGGFPYPTQLVMQHTLFATVMSLGLYKVKPALFPKLSDPIAYVTVDRDLMIRAVLPIAVLFAGHLVLSNSAYFYSTVPFLQMIKESNVVLTYIFSVLAALEKFNKMSLCLVVLIVFATAATIEGEIKFSLVGCLLQCASIFCESGKAVLQNIILSNTGRKLDPLSYVLLVSPVCFCVLGLVMACCSLTGVSLLKIASHDDIARMWPILLLNALVAFSLNLLMAAFVQSSSAMGFMLAGIMKDLMIVVVGVVAMHEAVSGQQCVAFTAQVVLIALWVNMKMFPEYFEQISLSNLCGQKSTKQPSNLGLAEANGKSSA